MLPSQTEMKTTVFKDVDWLPKPNLAETFLSDTLPPVDPSLICAAFAFVFDDQKRIVLTNLKQRGWDIPGGKSDPQDQTSSNTLANLTNTATRETIEEVGVEICNPKLIAYRRIYISGPKKNNTFPYPECYFVYFQAKVKCIHPLKIENQANGSIDRKFYTREEAEKLRCINEIHPTIFKNAIETL